MMKYGPLIRRKSLPEKRINDKGQETLSWPQIVNSSGGAFRCHYVRGG